MALKKKDKVESKNSPDSGIREVVRTEMLNVVTEVVIPALDQVYSAIDGVEKRLSTKLDDLRAETENNFSIVNRKLTDLSLDTPSRKEFNEHDHKIQRLERELGFV